MIYLRSIVFFIGMVASALVVTVLGLMVAPFSFSIRYRVISRWAVFVIWWLKVTCNLNYQVSGLENFEGVKGAIIFSKHQSAWETLAFQLIFPPQVWILKRSLLWVPFFGWGLALLRPIAIDRKAGRKAMQQVVSQGINRLKSGIWVVIFPEGTRLAPGVRKKFARGGANLADQSGYPVIPVAHNAGTYWPRRGLLKQPGTVELHIGPAIDTSQLSANEINQRAEQWINSEMEKIEGR